MAQAGDSGKPVGRAFGKDWLRVAGWLRAGKHQIERKRV